MILVELDDTNERRLVKVPDGTDDATIDALLCHLILTHCAHEVLAMLEYEQDTFHEAVGAKEFGRAVEVFLQCNPCHRATRHEVDEIRTIREDLPTVVQSRAAALNKNRG